MSKIPVGLELYSVRESMSVNRARTLEAVSRIGYKAVEFAGWTDDPEEFRRELDGCGLKCTSWHINIDNLEGDALKRTAEICEILNNKYVIVPYMPPETFETVEKTLDFCKRLNDLTSSVSEYSLHTGYHNHVHEFSRFSDGTSAWSIIAENTENDFTMQLDTGHAFNGQARDDEIFTLDGRLRIVHVKPFSRACGYDVFIGNDDVDYPKIFSFCSEKGGTHSYIVEFEGGSTGGYTDIEKAEINYKCLMDKFGDML